jgi:hypothetical protein
VVVRGGVSLDGAHGDEGPFCKFAGMDVVVASFVGAVTGGPSLSRAVVCFTPSSLVARSVAVALVSSVSAGAVAPTFRYVHHPRLSDISRPSVLASFRGHLSITGLHLTLVTHCRYTYACRLSTRLPVSGVGVCPSHHFPGSDEDASFVVPTVAASNSFVICTIPPLLPGHYLVDVNVLSQAVFTDSGLTFQVSPDAIVKSLTPSIGPFLGGTNVQVFGANFLDRGRMESLVCRFNKSVVPSFFVSFSEVRCIAPKAMASHTEATIPVTVEAYDHRHRTPPSRVFFTYKQLFVHAMFPTQGPVSGGTVVTLHGHGFLPQEGVAYDTVKSHSISPAPVCEFGGHTYMIGEYVSNGVVLCTVPAAPHVATAGLASTVDGDLASETIRVRLKQYGALFSGEIIFMYFADLPFVSKAGTSVKPLSGPTRGGTIVTITVRADGIRGWSFGACYFGSVESPGTQMNLAGTWRTKSRHQRQQPHNNARRAQSGTTSDIQVEFLHSRVWSAWTWWGQTSDHISFRCVSPPYMRARMIDIKLSFNGGRDVHSYGFVFRYEEPIVLSAVIPSAGTSTGGTTVAAYINNLTKETGTGDDINVGVHLQARADALGYLRCRFNSTAVSAIFQSDFEVMCTSPPYFTGAVAFDVSTNDQQFSVSSLTYTYVIVRIQAIVPAAGPIRGGTVVAIQTSALPGIELSGHGEYNRRIGAQNGFRRSRDSIGAHDRHHGLRCIFGVSVVPATVLSPHKVVCVSPSVAVTGGNRLSIDAEAPTAQQSTVRIPQVKISREAGIDTKWEPVHTPVTLATEAVTLLTAGPFGYDMEIALLSARPPFGPAVGGTRITITARDLPCASEIWCGVAFSNISNSTFSSSSAGKYSMGAHSFHGPEVSAWPVSLVFPAAILSSSSVVCMAPPAFKVGLTALRLSYNGGIDFSTTSALYTYVPPPRIAKLAPSMGPTLGGTTIVIEGVDIYPHAAAEGLIICRFEQGSDSFSSTALIVQATVLSDNKVHAHVHVHVARLHGPLKSACG